MDSAIRCNLCEEEIQKQHLCLHLKSCVEKYILNNNSLSEPIFVAYYTCAYILNLFENWDSRIPLNRSIAFKIYWFFLWKANESNADSGLKNNYLKCLLCEIPYPNEQDL